ncbi:MAG: ATP-grasp domain-containing protein [Lysobacterales bacterium]|jgi:predicted ATP-grasp superfamily ATP-dependent carboligase
MRLLVTNTRTGQAYAIIRSLRPHAEWISATRYGSSRLTAYTATAAASRLVNRSHYVTSPEEDWAAGKIQDENTEREERYIRDIEAICRRDRIDTIFPSYDPQVYILTKNRERLSRIGVSVLAPELDTVRPLLDKSKQIALAAEAGFPHPATFRVGDEGLDAFVRAHQAPWVVRPTASARSRGMAVVSAAEELPTTIARLQQNHRDLIVQEYVPGTLKQNFYLFIGRGNRVLSFVAPRVLRTSHRIYRNSSAAVIFNHEHEYRDRVIDLVQRLNWHGGLTVQTKIDARDGSLQLMEINPRMGSHLWYSTEMGIDMPWMFYRDWKGESVDPIVDYPGETLLLEPFEDFFGLLFNVADRLMYRLRRLSGHATFDADAAPVSLSESFRTLRENYTGQHPKAFMPQFRYGLSDPMVFLLKSWAVLHYELRQLRRAGL